MWTCVQQLNTFQFPVSIFVFKINNDNIRPLLSVCVCYLNIATQLQVGQPMTKLLSGFVLPSHTSSIQPAVHISHTHTWAFCLKWLADLEMQRKTWWPEWTHTNTLIWFIYFFGFYWIVAAEWVTGKLERDREGMTCSKGPRVGIEHSATAARTEALTSTRSANRAHTHTCAYLALAITSMSVNRKRCRSWLCIPVFSCACPWRRNVLSEPVRKDWTNGQLSGQTGSWKLSLENKKIIDIFYHLKCVYLVQASI